MPRKKSDLGKSRNRKARLQRALRARESEEQTAARNTAQRIRARQRTEIRRQEQRDKLLLQNIAMPKIVEGCRECEMLKNKISMKRPPKTSTERSRECRERKRVLKNAARQELNISSSAISNIKRETAAEQSDDYYFQTAMPRTVVRECDRLKYKTSTRQPAKTSTERSRESRERKRALKRASSISNFKPKTAAERSFEYRARKRARQNDENQKSNDLTRIGVKVEVHRDQEICQSSTLPMNNIKTSMERCCVDSGHKMADDIDIEEHDVLDNPRIKTIFPDITCIKTELINYKDEGLDSGHKMADDLDIKEHDVLDNSRIKNTFPDITCIKTEAIDYEHEDINDSVEESYEKYQQELTDPEILECSVVLEDWGDSLKNNPCFCSDCEILFPTENALDSHEMTAHSFLVSVGRNKAIKSTTKSSIAARLQFETDSDMEISNLCNHCNKVLPGEISFLKQSDELSTTKYSSDICDLKFENVKPLKQPLRTYSSLRLYCCPVCSCYFKFTKILLSHMVDQHQVDVEKARQRVKTTYKCRFCPEILKDNNTYNAHIRNSHPELYNKKSHKVECQPCNLTFPSAYSEKIHQVSRHAIEFETNSISGNLDKQIKIEPLSPKIAERLSQHASEFETNSISGNLDKHIKIEPLSPEISDRVSQHAIESETCLKSVDLHKQIKIEPLSPEITPQVSQHVIQTYSKSVNLDKQIKIEPLSPKISERVSQHEIESETYSKSVNLDKQIKIEPLSPKISERVSQHVIQTYSKSVNLDKQIKIEPPSPIISDRVSQHLIESETYSKSVNLDKQIKIEPLSPEITQTDLKQELQ